MPETEAKPFTAAELAACARRELGKRRYVYPRQVEGKKLSQETADRELAMMEAIVNHFQALAEVTVAGVAP